jgi:uroporphyrinogen-III synthase
MNGQPTNPLNGKRVVATRAEGQTAQFVAMLKEAGAIPIVFPTIQIVPLDDYRELDAALQHLGDFSWVIFTSVNGVRNVFSRMQTLGISPEVLKQCQVAAIGPATEGLIRENGIEPALRPDEYIAEAIVAGLLERGPVAGQHILLLRVDIARAVLREQLTAAGALVNEIPVYRTVLGQPDQNAYNALRAGVDIITFTSSSTVRNFFALLGDEAATIANKARIACIGPITAQTAREMGLSVGVVAQEYTMRGLIHALEV